jgi:alanyl-tRNA synthetase
VSAAEVEKIEADKFRLDVISREEESNAEISSIRLRLNEAIQDKWLTETKMQKMQKVCRNPKTQYFLFVFNSVLCL